MAELEPKPGVPPTTSHLSSILKQMHEAPANLIIYSQYQDPKPAKWLSHKTGIQALALPSTVGTNETLFHWMDHLVQLLKENMQ